MTRVAVIAHRGKTLGGGLPELRRVLERARRDRRVLARGGEEQVRARSRSRRRSTRKAELIFVWGGDGMVQRCVDVARGHARRRSRSSRPARRTCSRRTSASRRTSRRRSTSASRAHARRIDVGRMNGERFAVMAGAGFDARMIGDADGGAEGSLRPARLRLDGREAPAREAVPARRSTSTARAGTTARRAASCSATSASCSAASRRSRTRSPTTACSSSASSRPTASREWARHDRARRRRHGERSRRTRSPRRRTRCASSSIARCPTRSTAATARRCASCAIDVEPDAVRDLRARRRG